MHAPDWVCDELYRIHPQLRLGWEGRDRKDGEELNQGRFAVIQLYHQRDASRTYKELWNYRGPIFGKDFDRLFRVPVYVIEATPQEVFSGKILKDVKYWLTPIKQRIRESARQYGKELNDDIEDLAGEMGQELYWRAQRDTSGGVPSSATVTEEDKALLSGERYTTLEDIYDPGDGALIS